MKMRYHVVGLLHLQLVDAKFLNEVDNIFVIDVFEGVKDIFGEGLQILFVFSLVFCRISEEGFQEIELALLFVDVLENLFEIEFLCHFVNFLPESSSNFQSQWLSFRIDLQKASLIVILSRCKRNVKLKCYPTLENSYPEQ